MDIQTALYVCTYSYAIGSSFTAIRKLQCPS